MHEHKLTNAHLSSAVMVELLHDAVVWVLLDGSVALIAHQQVYVGYLQPDHTPISCRWVSMQNVYHAKDCPRHCMTGIHAQYYVPQPI